jgi:hypothetical protein
MLVYTRAEEELRKAYDELERRVKERTGELHDVTAVLLDKFALPPRVFVRFRPARLVRPDGRRTHANRGGQILPCGRAIRVRRGIRT